MRNIIYVRDSLVGWQGFGSGDLGGYHIGHRKQFLRDGTQLLELLLDSSPKVMYYHN